ncbi:hypothetical protein [Cellulomonas sp. NTE-D12]|uniref:hypothetical protein n=1 Tax=Cellulomonas sp. NTE-D12 TaxID=2962632 RepID=UPI00308127EC|nr:hypothetical protein CELD12_26450 [Cellulomonas sp. NTE-D12]
MPNVHRVPPHLIGTESHPDASDLSRFLVHMTRDEKDLASIVMSGHLEARTPFGLGRTLFMVADKHQSACFTAMPLAELGRLAARGREYGIGFTREFLVKNGGQPVWYVNENSPQHLATQQIQSRLVAAKDWDDPFWLLTPFIDRVIPGTYVWDWEREWRLPGGLHFEWEDIAFLIAPDGTALEIDEEPTLGMQVFDPDGGQGRWWGGSLPAFGDRMDLLLDQFHAEYLSPDDAGFPYVTAEGGYQWLTPEYGTADAVDDLFGEYPWHVRERLTRVLDGEGSGWARCSDVEAVWE